jgi:sugar-specific transcriptional regulator TrmB
MESLIEFLNTANLSTYEINAYITLLKTNDPLTARDISDKSKVPSGRIYEILEDLNKKGMIEIIESRPKKFRSFPLNTAFYNLISHQTKENNRRIAYLFDQAKFLEQKLSESEIYIKKEPTKIFWSTAYGWQSILSLYTKFCNETQKEILLNNFVNKSTLKILPYSHKFFIPLKSALERGINVKFLWCFDYDERQLTEEEKSSNLKVFKEIVQINNDLFKISSKYYPIEMKFINKQIPTYYDIFDKNRIIFKLRNPLKPYQIFACMNILDPDLGKELREKYLSVWEFEAVEDFFIK